MKIKKLLLPKSALQSFFLILMVLSCTLADHPSCEPLAMALTAAQTNLTTAQTAEATALANRNSALQNNLVALAALTAATVALLGCVGGPLACALLITALAAAVFAQDVTEQQYNAAQTAYTQAQATTVASQTAVTRAQGKLDSCRAVHPTTNRLASVQDSINYYNHRKDELWGDLKLLGDLQTNRLQNKKSLEGLLTALKTFNQDPKVVEFVELTLSKSQIRAQMTSNQYEETRNEYEIVLKQLHRLK